jgi:CheY-like chemotaxis protein
MNRPICIIDDDEDIRAVMTYALESEGMQSLPFGSAKNALEYLKRLALDRLPCLIIVDFMMPEMNGEEFINLLKKQYPDSLGKIPIVLSSGRLVDETTLIPSSVRRLNKPVDLDSFYDVAREFYFKEEFSTNAYL